VFFWVILVFSSFFSLQAQKKDTEFWLTFGYNVYSFSNINLQIRIVSGEYPTTVTIHFTNLGESESITYNMAANSIWTHPLSNTQKQAVYNTIKGKSDKSIHITSTEPVKVYALNYRPSTTDATNIFAVDVLGNCYYQISYSPVSLSDAYAVVAIQDNTHLYHSGDSVSTLNKGEVYYQTSSTDMTGSYITTNHPVAFFNVNQSAQIPVNQPFSNCFFQQFPPVKTWGKNFFVPVSHFTKERVRIVASQDHTVIKQTGGIFIYSSSGNDTINAGEYIELEVLLTNKGCTIIADKPVGVCSYFTGLSYNGLGISNPSQVWLPSIEQFVNDVLMAPFIPSGTSFLLGQRVIVVTSTVAKDSTKVSINGGISTTLDGGSWYDNDTAGMSFYNMPLSNSSDSYMFSNSKGLLVLCYGYGNLESYYYLAGSAMRDLDAAFYANDVHFQDLKDTAFCAGNVNFRAEIENMGVDMDSIKWFINGEENLPYNQLEWSKTFLSPGNYEIRMWVRFENSDTILKKDTLRIKNCEVNAAFYVNNVNLNLQDTTFCNKTVSFITYIEGLNTTQDSIKWYIDFGNGFEYYEPALNKKQWFRDFSTGNFPIKMWARLENDVEIEVESTLKMEILWIKIRNVRY